jgi:HAD superfamily hydrolase (TIGR01549 family)
LVRTFLSPVEYLNGNDLYPDVRPCLQTLKDAGYFVGIAGNQTTRAGHFLRELKLPCDVLATSDDWGVTKPDVAFFSKLIAVSGHQPHEIAYVGDRLDNDLRPAAEAGLRPPLFGAVREATSATSPVPRTSNSAPSASYPLPSRPCQPTDTGVSCMRPVGRRERRGCSTGGRPGIR